jgi:hypothetical protein
MKCHPMDVERFLAWSDDMLVLLRFYCVDVYRCDRTGVGRLRMMGYMIITSTMMLCCCTGYIRFRS